MPTETTTDRVYLQDLLPNVARIIYDAYPSSDLLPIDPEVHCTNLLDLREAARDCGDPLFYLIVSEIYERDDYRPAADIENRFAEVFRKVRDDIYQVEAALSNALYRLGK